MTQSPLIRITALSKSFAQRRGLLAGRGEVWAVRGVSLDIRKGETLGVVGESGCGKSTLGRMLIGLLDPSGGEVFINGEPLYDPSAHADYKAFRRGLAGQVQMIFQDPYSSLNPRMRIGESIAEPLRCSSAWLAGKSPSAALINERTAAVLTQVGLETAAARRYPHEFSGGQRQRIAIARALATRPAFVVCDEPTSSLDASVQSQVLNLLRDMQEELGLTYCFISHDLSVVRHMSDRVAVMYQGLVVEEGEAEAVFAAPRHPYTDLLLDSVPGAAFAERQQESSPSVPAVGQASSPAHAGMHPSEGECPFAPRCPKAMDVCRIALPSLQTMEDSRRVRCFLLTGPSSV